MTVASPAGSAEGGSSPTRSFTVAGTLLTIHHVRDDVADPLPWDLGFLALGALLVGGGLALRRDDRARARLST